MNSEVLSRLSQLKNYIETINANLQNNQRGQAITNVSKFKKSSNKEEYIMISNQMMTESLKQKNQKLKVELQQIKQQKDQFVAKIAEESSRKKEIKNIVVGIYISRLTLVLSDADKVQYEDVKMSSDYYSLLISSQQGKKYQQYQLPMQGIDKLQNNDLYLSFKCLKEDTLYSVLIKFDDQKDAKRWATCLRFAKLIQINKNKQRLFQVEKKKNDTDKYTLKPTFSISMLGSSVQGSSINHKPMLQKKLYSIQSKGQTQSVFSDTRPLTKQGTRSNDKSKQKSIQKDLTNSKSTANKPLLNVKSTIRVQKPQQNGLLIQSAQPTFIQKRVESQRSNYLPRIRGKSDQNQMLKIMNKNNPRKQSQDTFQPHVIQNFHNQKLQNHHFHQSFQDDSPVPSDKMPIQQQQKVKEGFPAPKQNLLKPRQSDRWNKQGPRKQSLTQQVKVQNPANWQFPRSNTTPPKQPLPSFLGTKLNWIGIQQKGDDQNNSKASYMNSQSNKSSKSRKTSQINPFNPTISYEKKSQISQRSQEQSPLPKTPSYEPHKISYQNGTVIRLHQIVQNTNPATGSPASDQSPNGQDYNKQNSRNDQESQSQYESSQSMSNNSDQLSQQDESVKFQQLKKYITLTKCSANGFWPHQKTIYLSQNEKQLCIRDIADKKVKKVAINNIQSVQYKKFYKGILKHMQGVDQQRCLVIRALAEDNVIKNLQFVGNEVQSLKRFANLLEQFVNYKTKQT